MRFILAKVSIPESLHPTSTIVHLRLATIRPSRFESTALFDFGRMIESAAVALALCALAAAPDAVSASDAVVPAASMLAAVFRAV